MSMSDSIWSLPEGSRSELDRYKHLIGDKLKARSWGNQQVESRLGCAILNRMIHLGKPQSYRVEKSN